MMRTRTPSILVGLAALLSACASGAAGGPSTNIGLTPIRVGALKAAPLPAGGNAPEGIDRIIVTGARSGARKGNLDDYLRALSSASCPGGAAAQDGAAIPVFVRSAALAPSAPGLSRIDDLAFVAGYTLTSSDTRFSGLSDIDVLDNGNLIGVSDAGVFVWIDLAADGLTPTRARIAPMRDGKGELLRGVADADAAGVALNDGIALVSFEENHRVLAFDLGKCGAGARGAPIVFGPYGLPLQEAFDYAGLMVGDRNGASAIGVTPRWYLFSGVGAKVGDISPLSARPIEADPDFSLRVGVEVPELSSLDVLPAPGDANRVRAFLLHRAGDSKTSSAITETDLQLFTGSSGGGELQARANTQFVETGWRVLATLDPPIPTRDYRGIAAKDMPDGRTRLFVLAREAGGQDGAVQILVFDLRPPLR